MHIVYRAAAVIAVVLLSLAIYLGASMLSGRGGPSWLEPSRDERVRATAQQFSQNTPRAVSRDITLNSVEVAGDGVRFEYTVECWPDNCDRRRITESGLRETGTIETCGNPQLKSLLDLEGTFVEVVFLDASMNLIKSLRIENSSCILRA